MINDIKRIDQEIIKAADHANSIYLDQAYRKRQSIKDLPDYYLALYKYYIRRYALTGRTNYLKDAKSCRELYDRDMKETLR